MFWRRPPGADEGTEGGGTPGRKSNLWDGSTLDFPFGRWVKTQSHKKRKETKAGLALGDGVLHGLWKACFAFSCLQKKNRQRLENVTV